MKNLLASWFRSLTAFDESPVEQSFSIVDPTAAQADGLNTVVLAVAPSDGNSPTIVSLRFDPSGVKLFEKKYQDDQDAQTELSAMASDLNEAASLSKSGKTEEAKKLAESLFEKYKRHSDPVVNEQPTPTMTQASKNASLVYKGFSIKQLEDGSWQASQDELAFWADSIDSVKAKVDNMLRKAYGKKLAKRAEIVMQNLFFSTPDEAMEYQEKMKKLQGPETGEGKPLWEQMGGDEQVAPSNESAPEEDNELAPPSLSFDRIEKDKAKHDKDIGKRIKDQVKTEVESALEQKSASVFGVDQEELVDALRKNGRNWDEIKKIFVKELSYNEDDTTVFLDSIRQKEEGGPAEGLPLPPKPPEDLVSPETHDKLVKEIEDKSEPKPELKPEPLPLADEIARADNAEIRKVAGKHPCPKCKSTNTSGGEYEQNHRVTCKDCGFEGLRGMTPAEDASWEARRKNEFGPKKASLNKSALNPLQEPPAVGQTPGQPLAAPVEEAPTFDSPVPPAPESTPEPEFLEAPKAGDRVYVMGDYETGEDGYEGTMVSDYTSRGDEYAVISKDNGENAEVALHRVVKASQKKVAQVYYEKKADQANPRCRHERDYGVCDINCTNQKPPTEEKEIPEHKEADLEVEGKGNEDVIRMFISDSFPKDKMPVWGTTNLKITKYPNGWALVNYQTPILYRANGSDVIVFNTHKYSVTTSKIQNYIRRNFAGQPVKETDEAGIYSAIDQSNLANDPEVHPELQSLHESALKIKAELEHEGEIALYFHKEGIEKQASGDSAFEGNGWCRVWIQEDEIAVDAKYPAILKLPDENQRITALKDLARDLAHQALREADHAANKVGVQAWFDVLTPSDHDRIDWVALANPKSSEDGDLEFEREQLRKYGPEAVHPDFRKDVLPESSQTPKIEKKADETLPAMKSKNPNLKDPNIDPYKHHSDLEWETGDPCKLCKSPIDENCVCTNPKCEFCQMKMGQGFAATKPEGSEPDEVSLIMAYESGELDDAGILKLFSMLIKNGHAWSLQGHYGRTAKALIDAGYINENGTITKDVVDTEIAPEQKLLSKQYAFKVEKQAADPIPAPESPKEVPTTFKKHLKAPPSTEREKALPATPEQGQLVKEVESSLSSLEAIKSLVEQAKAKLNAEIKAIEEKGGRVQIEGELRAKIEHLSKLVEATQNQMIYAGDTMVRLVQETKEHKFKPSDKWKVEKLTERLSKYEDAAKYLKQAEDGAQHLATSEDIRELYFFPRKMSKLHKSAGFLETLDSVYNDVLEALKLIVGTEQEQPMAV